MKALRFIAVILALALVLGETWRSWGAGRPLVVVIDDYFLGVMLVAGALAMTRDTIRRRALFAAAWGLTTAGAFSSFMSKLFYPQSVNAGNWNAEILTAAVGGAFVVSLFCMVASFILPPYSQEGDA